MMQKLSIGEIMTGDLALCKTKYSTKNRQEIKHQGRDGLKQMDVVLAQLLKD
ncbi:hypothetical protein [Undibacterium sp. Ji49W]|uniref:hypothetical protein n=1 Tax=Undibacterium sp. Ji49W TaxID=3413040 RepID=UPI003BF09CAE